MSDAFTIIGARGFIGRTLAAHLSAGGHRVNALDRWPVEHTSELGHVIDCGGLTADFRSRRQDVFHAHAGRIDTFLKHARFTSYLYLSSTRLYKASTATSEESPLSVTPTDSDDSYNISKIAGEAICLNFDCPAVRVARLSNVIGDNPDPAVFLNSLILDAATKGRIVLGEGLASAKDYIDAGEVCRYLELIALGGKHRLYNVAHGENRDHATVLARLARHLSFEVSAPEQPVRVFPRIANKRLVDEFGPPRVTPDEAIDKVAGMARWYANTTAAVTPETP